MIEADYENWVVLFVDILGWKEELNINSADSCSERYIELKPSIYGRSGFIFSDCFVWSMLSEFRSRLCQKVSKIICDFLNEGFLVRGGFSVGSLYHMDQIVCGPALLRAYELKIRSDFAPCSHR